MNIYYKKIKQFIYKLKIFYKILIKYKYKI